MTAQPLTIASLGHALSHERLASYSSDGDPDVSAAAARYLWNLSLTIALQPALHAVEITLRNHLYAHAARLLDSQDREFREVRCWLDAEPTLLAPYELRSVEIAKDDLRKSGRPMTPGRLVAQLGFGFWVSLCKRPYEQGGPRSTALWPRLLRTAFPALPRPLRHRAHVFHVLEPIRILRNRVSHHEPIWRHDLPRAYAAILEVLGWMNPGMAAAVRMESWLLNEHSAGPQKFAPMTRRLLRAGATGHETTTSLPAP